MSSRVHNFGAGPATLPVEVLEEAAAEMLHYKGSGMSIMEASHRGKDYGAVHEEALANLKTLVGVDDSYSVLLLHGGASLQFAMVPLNLLGAGQVADYVCTGAWSAKALAEARLLGAVNVAADSSRSEPARMPRLEELRLTDRAAYVHITSNETISGTQWKAFPDTASPLVADMSSDILSRPVDAGRFGLIYAGAQKNLGPAGVAVVVIRRDLAERAPPTVPTMLRYRTHIETNSLFNTPPCFNVYILMLVTRWLLKQGLENIYRRNVEKSARIYAAIDTSCFYRGTASPESRSNMNVTFRLPSVELEELFVKEAAACGLKGLKGHRTVGGIRASCYNALPVEAVDALVSFMKDFERRHG